MKQKINLYFNKNKLYLIDKELIEINNKLLDYITQNASKFKILQTLFEEKKLSKNKIETKDDLDTFFEKEPIEKSVINYYGFMPKLITQKDLSDLSQVELAAYGEGYSYFNTNVHKLYFLKKDNGVYYWDKGQQLVGLMGPKGEKGERGRDGEKGEKGERGVQGPAMNWDFIYPRPIEDLIISQITLNKIGSNKFIFCSNDGKIYVTKKNDEGNIELDGGWEFVGMEGPKGEKGDKGEKGEKGEDGVDGQVMQINEYVNYNPQEKSQGEISQLNDGYSFLNVKTGLIHIVYNADGYKYISDGLQLAGPRGVKGEKGDKGIQGDKGDKGEPGVMGLPGPAGKQGEQGEKGEMGPAFNPNLIGEKLPQNFTQNELKKLGQGYSYFCTNTGKMYFIIKENEIYKFSVGFDLKGQKGEKGDQGERGEKGEQGKQGEKGLKGDKGEKGEKGERGDVGVKGERGERGLMGMQGPAFSPDFRLPINPTNLSIEELEKYGEGTSILSTLNGKLYFIHVIEGELGVSEGYDIIGEKGERGERGEKGEVGPRGLQGLPGKVGDSYFVYNDNRNLSYKKGGISIGKNAELMENESLRIGSLHNNVTKIVIEAEDIIEKKNIIGENEFIEIMDEQCITYKANKINWMDKLEIDKKVKVNNGLIVTNLGYGDNFINMEEKMEIIGKNINIIGWDINKDFICNEHISLSKDGISDLIHFGDKIEICRTMECQDINLIGDIRRNNKVLWKYDEKHYLNGDVKIGGKLLLDELEIDGKHIKGDVKMDNLHTNKLEGDVGDIEEINVRKIQIGKNIIEEEMVELQLDKFYLDAEILDINVRNCKMVLDRLKIGENVEIRKDLVIYGEKSEYFFGDKMIVRNVDVNMENVNLEVSGKIEEINLEKKVENVKENINGCKIDGKNVEYRMENMDIKIDKLIGEIDGQIDINGFLEIGENGVIMRGRMMIDNGEFYYYMGEKNWIKIKDDICLMHGEILCIDDGEMRVRNSLIKLDESSKIEIGDNLEMDGKNMIMRDIFVQMGQSKMMFGEMNLVVMPEKMEMNGYELEMNDVVIRRKANGGDLLISGNEIEVSNMRFMYNGLMSVNGIEFKVGGMNIYDTDVNLENSVIKIGVKLRIDKDRMFLNNYPLQIENGDIMIKNGSMKMEKVNMDISGEISVNGILRYNAEGKERLRIENKIMKMNGLVISGDDISLRINGGLMVKGKQIINRNFEWLLKDVKIDYDDGKLIVNPNFTKMKNYKLVLEQSILLYKDDTSNLLLEKNMIYIGDMDLKLKDSVMEFMDKNGKKFIDVRQNRMELSGELVCRGEILMDKVDWRIKDSILEVKGGKWILEDYRIMDEKKSFLISPQSWEFVGVNFVYGKGSQKMSGVNIERTFVVERSRNVELEYGKSKFLWNDEKNKTMLFMGDRLMQNSFPVVEYIGSDLILKTKEGMEYGKIGNGQLSMSNGRMSLLNTKLEIEKNGFPIFGVMSDEIYVKNVPLKLEDSYLHYIYERKNASLLVKNDNIFTNFMDIDIRNGQINWNNGKVLMVGNYVKMSGVDMELSGGLIVKGGKNMMEVSGDEIRTDMRLLMRRDNVDYLDIGKGMMRMDSMQVLLKNCRFYNECLTLEQNRLKLDNSNFEMEKVDVIMRDSFMIIDGGYIRIGESEIREDSSLVLESKSKLRLATELVWEGNGQTLVFGGYNKKGYKMIISDEDLKMGYKDDLFYSNKRQLVKIDKEDTDEKLLDKLWERMKLEMNVNLGEDMVKNVDGERYMEQVLVNRVLMERIKRLEDLFLGKK